MESFFIKSLAADGASGEAEFASDVSDCLSPMTTARYDFTSDVIEDLDHPVMK